MSDDAEVRKIIFADFAVVKFEGVIHSLIEASVESESVSNLQLLLQRLAQEKFAICVVNLLLARNGPFDLIQSLRESSLNKDIKVIIVTKQMQKINVQNTLNAGANDFIGDPFEPLNLHNRILYHLGPVKVIEAIKIEASSLSLKSSEYVKILLEASELLSRTSREGLQTALYKILKRIADQLCSNRTSLIIVDNDDYTGVVLASSDDAKFYNFPIKLDKYPEVSHVMHTGLLVLVEDVARNALTGSIKNNVRTISIGSMMVFPVSHQGELVGVLTVRRPEVTELPPSEVLRVLGATANVLAAHANVAVRLRKIYQEFQKKQRGAA